MSNSFVNYSREINNFEARKLLRYAFEVQSVYSFFKLILFKKQWPLIPRDGTFTYVHLYVQPLYIAILGGK